jgi:F0F1-type ATP synthase assembly protein I
MHSQAPPATVAGGLGLVTRGSFGVVPAGERRETRATWDGFSNALAQAVELVGTTVIFVLGGLWIDGKLGTRPLFTVVLGLIAVVGLAVISYYKYQAQIARDEEGKPWTKNPR